MAPVRATIPTPRHSSWINLGDIGIKADFRNIDPALVGERRSSNEMQAGINWNTAPLFAAHTYPDYIPNTNWGPLWGQWYGDNEAGEEPPEWIMELYAIHEDLVSHPPGSEGFISASAARNAWLYENVPFFTHVENPGIVHMWSKCIGNVPDGAFHHGSWSSHKFNLLECRLLNADRYPLNSLRGLNIASALFCYCSTPRNALRETAGAIERGSGADARLPPLPKLFLEVTR